jgi:two-component system, NtrC family, response regulator AtoC
MAENLLILEDEMLLAKEMERRFTRQRWHVHLAGDLATGRRLLAVERIEPLVVIADMNLPDGNALDLLAALKSEGIPLGEWIFLTAYGTIPDSVRALQLGAYDFLEKPYEEARLDLAVTSAARCGRAQRTLRDQAEEGSRRYGPEGFIGSSTQARETRQLLAQIAGADFSALVIQGETGTGKGLAARIIHYSGPHVSGPLVEINCAALPENLLETELFGHEAGAFTGAKGRHRGLFEQADGGTLFLDEIGELPLGLQAKLLTAVEEKRIRRVGSERNLEIDARIIAATNRDLADEVAAGRFRSDLYHRLSVFKVRLPTLAERPEDIPELAWLLIAEFNERAHRRISRVPEPVWATLRSHAWPGNVRELRNVIERCVLLSGGDTLDQRWLQLAPAAPQRGESGQEGGHLCFELDGSLTLERIERRCLQEALKRRGGNVTQAARLLGMSRQSMRYRLEKHGLKAQLHDDVVVT